MYGLIQRLAHGTINDYGKITTLEAIHGRRQLGLHIDNAWGKQLNFVAVLATAQRLNQGDMVLRKVRFDTFHISNHPVANQTQHSLRQHVRRQVKRVKLNTVGINIGDRYRRGRHGLAGMH